MGPDTAIVAAGARLAAHGLIVGAEGNLSIRLDDRTLLVTPSGVRKDELRVADLVVIGLDPSDDPPYDGPLRPTSDLAIHRAIYRVRPDVGAIAHAHIPAAMALTLVGERPDPAVLPETALLLPRLPVVPFGAMGSQELATRVATAFAQPDASAQQDAGAEPSRLPDPAPAAVPIGAVILERHGAVAVGSTLEQAVDRLDLVDVLCRTWRDARLLAPDRRPTPPRRPGGGA